MIVEIIDDIKTDIINIGTMYGFNWELNPKLGKIQGFKLGYPTMTPAYEFWIGNPPKENYALFRSICDFAVEKGLLRQVITYQTL